MTIPTLSMIGDFGAKPEQINARSIRAALAEIGEVPEIELFVHSDGGDVVEGFSVFHQLLAHPARIVADVSVMAASMASVVIMAADEIRIAENGFIVLHNPFQRSAAGEAKDLRLLADLLDAFKANAIRAYRRHTRLSEDELSALMDAETWLSAEDAVRQGFAHTIGQRIEAVNQADLSRFEHIPATARTLLGLSNPTTQGGSSDMSKTDPKPVDPTPEETGETIESLWARIGQMLSRKKPEPASAAVLTSQESAAILAIERQALRSDRAQLHLDRDLAPHRAAIEPAQLAELEPILLKLKTAEIDGDADAGQQYASLAGLLPSLASNKAGGELAGSDDGAPVASLEVDEARRAIDERRGISDERRAALMKKYSGCRPEAVQVLR